jgi:hypothetical protein
LLDSSSNITPESAKVIRAAASAGVQVILATGKARPAAIAAARKAQLEGDSLLVSHTRPGVFLQVRTLACTAVRDVPDALPAGCLCSSSHSFSCRDQSSTGVVEVTACSAAAWCVHGAVQGLAVHGQKGQQLSDALLPPSVVADAFKWASTHQVSCVAFLGDECATLKLTDDLVELHTR